MSLYKDCVVHSVLMNIDLNGRVNASVEPRRRRVARYIQYSYYNYTDLKCADCCVGINVAIKKIIYMPNIMIWLYRFR